MRPKSGWARTVPKAAVMDSLEEVTSSGRMSTRDDDDDDGDEEERIISLSLADGLRAVATRRWVGCAAMSWARASPKPEEQPVINHTASAGSIYGTLVDDDAIFFFLFF